MSFFAVEKLTKYFLKGTSRIDVLKGVDLSFEKGNFVSIVGASGAGKSTLLHIMGGLERPTDGSVSFCGKNLYEKSGNGLAPYRNRDVGFVFQFHHLLKEFNALENVAMPMMISGVKRADAMKRASDILDEMGLTVRKTHKPGELSGGEQQRVAIARALINDPQVILADEPTGNLDSVTGEEIFKILLNQKAKRNSALVVVTHNEELAKRADQKLRLKYGTVSRE